MEEIICCVENKVKAYFQRGARAILGFDEYPNQVVGYGALCVENSLPNN